jgi:hypothetical protein
VSTSRSRRPSSSIACHARSVVPWSMHVLVSVPSTIFVSRRAAGTDSLSGPVRSRSATVTPCVPSTDARRASSAAQPVVTRFWPPSLPACGGGGRSVGAWLAGRPFGTREANRQAGRQAHKCRSCVQYQQTYRLPRCQSETVQASERAQRVDLQVAQPELEHRVTSASEHARSVVPWSENVLVSVPSTIFVSRVAAGTDSFLPTRGGAMLCCWMLLFSCNERITRLAQNQLQRGALPTIGPGMGGNDHCLHPGVVGMLRAATFRSGRNTSCVCAGYYEFSRNGLQGGGGSFDPML